jgi:Phage derived protein Gp49-like (DUF891)
MCQFWHTQSLHDRPHQETARAVLSQRGGAQSGQKVEFGWPIGRPHCAPLGKGLWEVRSALDSNRIARVIFCIGGGTMILLHSFIKKTQKTPQADIDLALKRKREVT